MAMPQRDLADSQQQAEQGTGNPAAPPEEMQSAQNGVRQGLAQASAELTARQQQIASEAAQAQAEAQGTADTGQHLGQHSAQAEQGKDHASLGHHASQGAKQIERRRSRVARR